MKKFIVLMLALSATLASAGEITVGEVSASRVVGARISTRFVVNQDGTAGVALDSKRHTHRDHTVRRTTVVEVPELSLVGGTLTLTVDGATTDCGTMGESRVLRLPVLTLSGNCSTKAVKMRNAAGKKVVRISIITK